MFGRKAKQELPPPTGLCNLHSHILSGVDDGAKSDEDMYSLMRLEYEAGVRYLCFTPHYNPALFEPKPDKITDSYRKAQVYALQNLPDLKLFLGNEVFMRPDTLERLRDGSCRPIEDTKTVLVEFRPTTPYAEMRKSLCTLLANGYKPLVAHIERYTKLISLQDVFELKGLGVKLQINTEAFTSPHKKLINTLIEQGAVDVIADDRHSLYRGDPPLSKSWSFVASKFSETAADALFIHRPLSILNISV